MVSIPNLGTSGAAGNASSPGTMVAGIAPGSSAALQIPAGGVCSTSGFPWNHPNELVGNAPGAAASEYRVEFTATLNTSMLGGASGYDRSLCRIVVGNSPSYTVMSIVQRYNPVASSSFIAVGSPVGSDEYLTIPLPVSSIGSPNKIGATVRASCWDQGDLEIFLTLDENTVSDTYFIDNELGYGFPPYYTLGGGKTVAFIIENAGASSAPITVDEVRFWWQGQFHVCIE